MSLIIRDNRRSPMSVFLLSCEEKFKTAAVVATTFISLIILIGTNTSLFSVPSSITTFAQMSNLNQSGSSSDAGLKFAYTKLGVLGGIYQLISYDSTTDVLTLRSSAAAIPQGSNNQSNTQSSGQLSESEKNSLKQLINDNGFFEANSYYPQSTKGAQNYTLLHVLSVTVDNRLHTVLWTDASNNVPASLLSIVQAIEKHQANDNQSKNQRNMNGGVNNFFNDQGNDFVFD
jgi:hypothetical protein